MNPSDKPLTFIPENKTPEFDYSGLDKQTVEDLHFAEDEYRHGKKLAERGLVHMGNAIAAAHDALCGVVQQLDNSKHGNRGDDSFRAWCCSIGITKSTAYNLLQVSALMDDRTHARTHEPDYRQNTSWIPLWWMLSRTLFPARRFRSSR